MDTSTLKELELLLIIVKSSAAFIIPLSVFIYKKEKKRKLENEKMQKAFLNLEETAKRIEQNLFIIRSELAFTQRKVARIPSEITNNGV